MADEVGLNPDPIFGVKAAAVYLGLDKLVGHPEHSLRRLVRVKRIRSAVVAGKICFRRSWLDEYVEANTREPVA